MNWTDIGDSMARTRVPWGWLVVHTGEVMTPMETGYNRPELKTGYEWRVTMTFVFDPFHWWKIK